MISKIIKNINNTKLDTPRLTLRSITIKDLRKIFEMRNKNFVSKMFRAEEEMNYKSHLKWFRKRKNRVDFAIISKKNKKIIGIINTVFYFKNDILYAELGKYIGDKNYHSKGLGSEATKEWVNFIFISSKIDYFFAQTLKDNFSNIRLNTKLGFKVLKNKNKNKDQDKIEWKIMKLTRKRWLTTNPELLRNIYFIDLKKILSWRNSLVVREISLDTAYITYTKHLKWYKKIQFNESYFSFIISLKNQMFGIVNLKKISLRNVKWSIYKKPHSKKGVGTFLAHRILNKIFFELGIKAVLASIFSSNLESIKFHESLGFEFKRKLNSSFSEFFFKKSVWMRNKDFINKKINTKYKIS